MSLSNASRERKRAAAVLFARCAHSLHERLIWHGKLNYSSKSKQEQRELKLQYLCTAVECASEMPGCSMAEVLDAAFILM
ncbi:MAG: hypothetical protein ACREXR_16275 [Gammaproteobacteria bacterium]